MLLDLSSFDSSPISVILRFNRFPFLEIGIGLDPTRFLLLYYSCHVKGFLLKPIYSINSHLTIAVAFCFIFSNSAFTFEGSSSPGNYSLAFSDISISFTKISAYCSAFLSKVYSNVLQ
jgi:hypothetical protein